MDGTCTDPAFPFCDENGEVEGQNQTCIAVECEPGEFRACRGDLAITCNSTGTDFDLITCDRGCDEGVGCHLCDPNETACTNGTVATCDAAGNVVSTQACPLGCFESEPRCRDIDPSNGLAQFLDAAGTSQDLDLSAGGRIDTVSGEVRDANDTIVPITTALLPAPPNGSPIRIIVANRVQFGNVQINAGITPGTGLGPALAIVANGEVTLTGSLQLWEADPEGFRTQPGSVDFSGCRGSNGFEQHPNNPTQNLFSGSGGGAHATAGGNGGEIELQLAGAGGGTPMGNPTLVPLRGGCEGGLGSGGGGGALQISSRVSITVGDGAIINANGNIGIAAFAGPGPFAGGGAGGGILLEAPTVALGAGARLLVNGGPAATASTLLPLTSLTDAASPGGTCASGGSFVCANGGDGAASGGPATSGTTVPYSNSPALVNFQAGGGGGGLGFIRINTGDGTFTQSSDAILSGSSSTAVVKTR